MIRVRRLLLLAHFTTALIIFAVVVGCARTDISQELEPEKPKAPLVPDLPIAQLGDSTLNGKISHKGQPITVGRICFFCEQGFVPTVGLILPDGTYSASTLPEGEMQICVLLDPAGSLPFPVVPTPPDPLGPAQAPRHTPGTPARPPGAPSVGDGLPGSIDTSREIFPPGIPPPVVGELRNFTVPADVKSLYESLHKTYSQTGKKNPLKFVVKAGDNSLDIELP